VVVELVCHLCDSVGTDDGAAAVGLDVCEEREDEQGLFGRVEIVCEEVAVGVPAFVVVGVGDGVVTAEVAEVDDEVVLGLLVLR